MRRDGDEDEEREKRKKRTLDVARESGTVGPEEETDSGDALSAEPSTTSIAETDIDIPEGRTLPTRLGPVRIKVGKTDDWVTVRVQPWTFHLHIDKAGRFPRTDENLPRSVCGINLAARNSS